MLELSRLLPALCFLPIIPHSPHSRVPVPGVRKRIPVGWARARLRGFVEGCLSGVVSSCTPSEKRGPCRKVLSGNCLAPPAISPVVAPLRLNGCPQSGRPPLCTDKVAVVLLDPVHATKRRRRPEPPGTSTKRACCLLLDSAALSRKEVST